MFEALVRAPELTPELRLVQTISEFAAVLPDSDRASFKVLQQTPAPSATDVIRITEEINRDGLRIHRGWQHQGTRLVGILDRIQLFSQAGDILIGGAQNIVASGVWAVFRVSLQLATGYLGFFDKASTFFMHVGKASAIQQELVLLYPDDRDLQRLMAEYLIVLIQACMHIALIAKQGTLGRLFASSDKEFQRFEADLERWTRLVNRRVTLLLAKTNSKNQTLILATADESAKRAEEESRFRLMALLSPHQLDFDITWRRERKKGVAKWIFEEASYEAWKRSDTSSVLWISGPIGSGKTVLMANLVGDLHNASQDSPFVASFFCDYAKNKSLLARNIIGSLAWQLVKPHLAVKDDLATKILDQVELLSDGDTDDVIQLLLSSLQTDRRYYVVVDSLDDCATIEIDNVILALKRLSQSVALNVCLSGRKDSVLQKVALTHLQVTYSISMSNEKRTREIAEFIATEITRRNSLGTIEVELQTLIKETLTAAADGM